MKAPFNRTRPTALGLFATAVATPINLFEVDTVVPLRAALSVGTEGRRAGRRAGQRAGRGEHRKPSLTVRPRTRRSGRCRDPRGRRIEAPRCHSIPYHPRDDGGCCPRSAWVATAGPVYASCGRTTGPAIRSRRQAARSLAHRGSCRDRSIGRGPLPARRRQLARLWLLGDLDDQVTVPVVVACAAVGIEPGWSKECRFSRAMHSKRVRPSMQCRNQGIPTLSSQEMPQCPESAF
jgi:hypothetical protein